MLKSEMQHQFWITKKVVQRKLGSKEDPNIVSSDADLDSKIELFKSISESCCNLYRIIDQYQERLCILAQEENSMGKFLKEAGKRSNTTGKNMINTGKSISYCGQQRMTIRVPLLRLHHEVEVFQCRAVADTQATLNYMEKERTEYRAALSWMKSASSQLDPDTGRGLEKFRKAQTHVRNAKKKFDRLSMDCIQKIDLLAAARCNMFSHGLVGYMNALMQFSKKASETYDLISSVISIKQQYEFTVLKDLRQEDGSPQKEDETLTKKDEQTMSHMDNDQQLFFLQDDFQDDEKHQTEEKVPALIINKDESNTLLNMYTDDEKCDRCLNHDSNPKETDTYDDMLKDLFPTSLLDDNPNNNLNTDLLNLLPNPSTLFSSRKEDNTQSNTFLKSQSTLSSFFINGINQNSKNSSNKEKQEKVKESSKLSSWLELFADLDPLANPELAKKMNGDEANSQDA